MNKKFPLLSQVAKRIFCVQGDFFCLWLYCLGQKKCIIAEKSKYEDAVLHQFDTNIQKLNKLNSQK
jgi:hypothetical protein